MKLALASTLVSLASAKVYLNEDFSGKYEKKWTVPSSWKPSAEMGKWATTSGKWYDSSSDLSLQTSEDARFYGLSAPLDSPLNNKDKDLVIQYTVKHEQSLDCGGAYIKLLPGGNKFDAKSFGGDTTYALMFGPDICGTSNRRTHVIFNYPEGAKESGEDNNLLIKKDVRTETDQLSHLYTLILRKDNTFEVLIDNKSERSGSLSDEFDFLGPKEIKDPSQKKPTDWVDERRIPDPTDEKPAGYDDIPPEIPDPDASKPDDWDVEDDGEWEPPMLDNPEFKGTWRPKMMDNPDYKGEWEHPMVPNPDFVDDLNLYARCDPECTHIGFELWQVTAGTMFDDILVTDSVEEAQKHAEENFFKKQEGEKKMHDDMKEKEREEAEKAREEAQAQAEFEDALEEEMHEEL